MGTIEIDRWDPGRDGPLTEEAMRGRLQSLGYEVSRYVYEPGTCLPDHSHGIDKIDAVLSGRFLLRSGEQSLMLTRGDWVRVPAGTVHSAEVIGPEPVLSLDAIKVR